MNRIPKVIHYIWFGGKPLPKSAERCIASWRKFFPDYEIKRWDESNYDVNKIPYTRDAYKAGKYAFVSDYARFDILYHEGGLYFDTDVEVIRPMYDIIVAGSFMGCENVYNENPTSEELKNGLGVNPGVGFGCCPGLNLFRDVLEMYKGLSFQNARVKSSPETVVVHLKRLLELKGLQYIGGVQELAEIRIYPSDFFSPISTIDGRLRITDNTRSIHWFDQSWQSPIRKYGRRLILALGGVRLKVFVKRILFKN